MSWETYTSSYLIFYDDTPQDVKEFIVEQLEELCEDYYLKYSVNDFIESFIRKFKSEMAKYKFNKIDKEKVRSITINIINEILEKFNDKSDELVLEDINWSSHVDPYNIEEFAKFCKPFVKDGWVYVYFLNKFGGYESVKLSSDSLFDDKIESWKEAFKVYLKENTSSAIVVVKIILNDKRFSDKTKKDVIKVFEECIFDVILSVNYETLKVILNEIKNVKCLEYIVKKVLDLIQDKRPNDYIKLISEVI